MKKIELQLMVKECVEAGKGLALADLLQDGEVKEKSEALYNKVIDDNLKQLELLCEDCDYKKIEELLEE